jgi:hypothetical protein
MPENGQAVKVAFKKSVVGFAVGDAASNITRILDNPSSQMREGEEGGGLSEGGTSMPLNVLVAQNFTFKIVAMSELDAYTPLRRGSMLQMQHLAIPPATLQIFSSHSPGRQQLLPLVIVYPSILQIFSGLDVDENGNDEYKVVYHYTTKDKTAELPAAKATAAAAAADGTVTIAGPIDLGGDSVIAHACSDKDFITVGNALKIYYYAGIGTDQTRSIIVEWAAGPMLDWVAESVICGITFFLSIDNALRLTTGQAKPAPALSGPPPLPPSSSSSSSSAAAAAAGGASGEGAALLARMQQCLVDPSRHSASIDSAPLDKYAYRALQSIQDDLSKTHCNEATTDDNAMELSCEEELDVSSQHSWFTTVKIDQAGKRLLITSRGIKAPDGGLASAYVFVYFGYPSGGGKGGKGCHHSEAAAGVAGLTHHAVIQADNEQLQKQVKYAVGRLHK